MNTNLVLHTQTNYHLWMLKHKIVRCFGLQRDKIYLQLHILVYKPKCLYHGHFTCTHFHLSIVKSDFCHSMLP